MKEGTVLHKVLHYCGKAMLLKMFSTPNMSWKLPLNILKKWVLIYLILNIGGIHLLEGLQPSKAASFSSTYQAPFLLDIHIHSFILSFPTWPSAKQQRHIRTGIFCYSKNSESDMFKKHCSQAFSTNLMSSFIFSLLPESFSLLR